MAYNMNWQLARGEDAERRLDRHFANRFHIAPATRAQQRQGIDRHFKPRRTVQNSPGAAFTVEYKTDWTAARTGNAFIETVSVDSQGIPGWVYTSRADWLAYYVPGLHRVYLITFAALRARLPAWRHRHPPAPPIPNGSYNTLGILVPLNEFARTCQKIEKTQP